MGSQGHSDWGWGWGPRASLTRALLPQAGSNDRKKEIAQRIIDDSGPSVITGRLGDIYAVSQDILEKGMYSVVYQEYVCVLGEGG